MKKVITITAMLFTAIFGIGPGIAVSGKGDTNRTFMFIGEPNAAAWQFMMDNPADRKAEVSGSFKALGGEVLSYYWGLGNGKNYITVTIPDDNELIQAIYLMRLPAGMLNSYQIIELMSSDQMSSALKRSIKLIGDDETVKR